MIDPDSQTVSTGKCVRPTVLEQQYPGWWWCTTSDLDTSTTEEPCVGGTDGLPG